MLKKPKDTMGYQDFEIEKICEDRGIKVSRFYKTLGVNTAGVGKDGKSRIYKCDVERALWQLGSKDGSFHVWD